MGGFGQMEWPYKVPKSWKTIINARDSKVEHMETFNYNHEAYKKFLIKSDTDMTVC